MNKRNLKRHIERKHISKHRDITATSHLDSACIDPENGIFTVNKSFLGPNNPLHVQNKVWGENQHVFCESIDCQVNTELAWRSGLKAYQCVHLKSITYCSRYVNCPKLQEETLTEMVKSRWFGEDKKKLCLDRQNLATTNRKPLSILTKTGTPESKKFISIYEPTISYYSRLGRVIVSYDTKKNSWHCPCAKTKRSCPHKYIAKWHLFETDPSLFRKVRSTDVEECLDTAPSTADESRKEDDVGDLSYPPEDYE